MKFLGSHVIGEIKRLIESILRLEDQGRDVTINENSHHTMSVYFISEASMSPKCIAKVLYKSLVRKTKITVIL